MAVLFYVLAAFGCMFVIGRLAGVAFDIRGTLKNYSYQIKKLREDLDVHARDLEIKTNFSKMSEEEIRKDISELKKQMADFHQFYYIDSEDDESLVSMVKHLHERMDNIELKLNPIIKFQEELSAFEKMNDEEKEKWLMEREEIE